MITTVGPSDITCEQLFLLLYSTGRTPVIFYDAEHDLLAIANFLVLCMLLIALLPQPVSLLVLKRLHSFA